MAVFVGVIMTYSDSGVNVCDTRERSFAGKVLHRCLYGVNILPIIFGVSVYVPVSLRRGNGGGSFRISSGFAACSFDKSRFS